MLANIRALSKTWLVGGLMLLLVVAFAATGMNDVFTGAVDNAVVRAGSHKISAAEFKRRFDGQKKELEQQNGPISPEMIVAGGLDIQVLRSLAGQESIAEIARRMGIRASDAQVAAELRKSQALFNPVTGKFDQEIYASRLAEIGMTPAVYEGLLRDEIATNHLFTGLAIGFRAPRIYAASIGAFALEQRDLAFLIVDPNMIARPAAPTDAELTTFMQQNAARLTKPEYRQLSVVEFNPAGLSAQAVIDPADVQKRFDFRKDTLSKPETRTLVQISAADVAQGAAIAARLAKGEDPAAVAKALNRPLTNLADRPRSALTDAKIAETAFTLQPGQSSGPVTAGLGVVVLKLISVTPGQAVDFATEKPKIEEEIRAKFAQDKVDEQVQAFDTAHTAGNNFAASAAKAGVTVHSIGPVSAQGAGLNGAPIQGLSPDMLKNAFALTAGADGEIQDAGGGVSYAVRVEKVIPAALPPMAEIKPLLTQLYTARKTMDAVTARADGLAERIRKGEAIEAVAASAGAQVQHINSLDRLRAMQDQNIAKALGNDILSKMFGVKAGEVFTADAGPPRIVVAKLQAIRAGDPAMAGRVTESQRPALSQQLFQGLQSGAQAYAIAKLKTRTDLTRARTAIGIAPEQTQGADPAAAAGKAAPKA
jgi:peptidyl-prolyl cis-trans isomerase D